MDNQLGKHIARAAAVAMVNALQGFESATFSGLWPYAAEALDEHFPDLSREHLQALAKFTASEIVYESPDTFVKGEDDRYRYGLPLPE